MSFTTERFDDLLRCFERLDVLVVGDVMLDEYLSGDVDRVSPEAPVPVVGITRELRTLGGAGNVVRNLVALGARARLATVVGDDGDGRHVVDLLKELGVDAACVVIDASRRTTRKTRIVARDQQLIRVDREDVHGLADDVARGLLDRVGSSLRGIDGLALVDYGKGVLDATTARALVALARERGVPVAVDPKHRLEGYEGSTLVKPNALEAWRLAAAPAEGGAAGDRGADVSGDASDDEAIAERLRARLPGSEIVITLGARGMRIADAKPGTASKLVPTAALDVYDVQGAGDTSLAALWLARLAGASLEEAAILGHAASGVAVSKLGTATATRDEVRARLPHVLEAQHRAGAATARHGGGR